MRRQFVQLADTHRLVPFSKLQPPAQRCHCAARCVMPFRRIRSQMRVWRSRRAAGQLIEFSSPTGAYTYTLPAGVYTLTASAYGYVPGTAWPVTITANLTTSQDMLLNLNAHARDLWLCDGYRDGRSVVCGTSRSTGAPFNPPFTRITTNPATGYYSVTLAADQMYTLTVSALLHVSQERSLPVLKANRTRVFCLDPHHDGQRAHRLGAQSQHAAPGGRSDGDHLGRPAGDDQRRRLL